ncbi:putative ribonuclease ii family protein [Theileria annulata]|uniref:Possible ribonuclease ii family protein n=1 Tax=Theileria annulata TaxID=5874 RepID=Q4UGX2_THEAN|nr:putative ribonuclease ii family protein [Theileria annulata]CAI73667.1 possible ribonuclease ii family protein [Theileria annulata]|eukprot:XP_954344.1 possible ribonuclease ii family protein [Theileria annulata]
MVLILTLSSGSNCSERILSKLSRLKYISPYFRNYEINSILTKRLPIYEILYNVHYTSNVKYTHTFFCHELKGYGILKSTHCLHNPNLKYYTSFSESPQTAQSSQASDLASTNSDNGLNFEEYRKNNNEISYEEYWKEEDIEELERKHPELVVRGTVFIPAFATSESKLILTNSNTNINLNKDIQKESGEQSGVKKKGFDELKIYGFISRNRTFHGDEVVAIKSRRQKLVPYMPSQTPSGKVAYKETPGECRVIKVLNRTPNLSSLVSTFNLSEFFDNTLEYVRCQPRDTRWPAFKVYKSDLESDVTTVLNSYKSEDPNSKDKNLLCINRFVDWKKSELEPKGDIIRVIGETCDPDSEMEGTMLFHGLDPKGFSEAVLANLNELIQEGNKTKWDNRKDMNHLFVISIDPQDAKDLDDALSIEFCQANPNDSSNGGIIYTIGVHVADVSHFVKENSLVDLDARTRATSVYLEHLVYPMLPQQLSEDLCSLLPKKEKLCFSVFVDVSESGEGEKVGNDLYIKDVNFVLSTITSKNRLTYDNAKTMLYCCLNIKRGGKELDLASYSFRELEKMIEDLGINDETKLSLVRLYYLSQKMRYYRLKQLGAVHVDIDGSIKCHIPKLIHQNQKSEEPIDRYLNNKGKLDRKYMLRVEKIPKESHELIEEMMLLANTQVAKFISEKIDLYFLRTHEDTSKAVKSLIAQMLPKNLKNLIQVDKMTVTEVLSKCEHYMDPSAFQSLSFSVLQKFKEAIYSPIHRDVNASNTIDTSNTSVNSVNSLNNVGGLEVKHWGLALPVYLHFTSPIRRYPDLYTHRMLKDILYSKVRSDSVDLLSEICERCNLQKRRAFDAQKEYKNFAFNKYLQFLSFIAPKLDRTYLKSVSISQPFTITQDNCEESKVGNSEVWGYLYTDACISSIISNNQSSAQGETVGSDSEMKKKISKKEKTGEKGDMGKSSIVFYIPLLNEQRSVSCDSLGVKPVNFNFDKTSKKRQRVKSSILNSYYQSSQELENEEEIGKKQPETQGTKAQGITVMMNSKRLHFYIYQKARVLLIPGSKMWTVRLPIDYLK